MSVILASISVSGILASISLSTDSMSALVLLSLLSVVESDVVLAGSIGLESDAAVVVVVVVEVVVSVVVESVESVELQLVSGDSCSVEEEEEEQEEEEEVHEEAVSLDIVASESDGSL